MVDQQQQSRPTRRVSRPPAKLRDERNFTLGEETVARSQGRKQPTGNSRKRSADSLASHPILSDPGEDDDDYQQDSDSDSCSDDEEPASNGKGTVRSGNSRKPALAKAVRVVKTKSGPAAVAKSQGVARPLDKAEREQLADAKRSRQNQGTRRAYAVTWAVWERWCESSGYAEGGAPIQLDISMPTAEVVGAFARFLKWYAEGRKGDASAARKGGRKASGDQLASLNGVHAALQDGVNHACQVSGTPAYKLAEQPDYGNCYQLYCKKSAARSSAQNSDNVHLSMTADDLVQICEELLRSDNKEDIRNLSMILYQFATVSRGDDVRPRKLSELMVRYLKSVGPSKCPSIAVMQPPGAGKTLKNRPAWKAFIRNQKPECCPVRALFAWLSCQFLLNSEPLPMPGDPDFLLFPGTKPGEPMSLPNHARIIQKIFEMVGIDPPKVTHEFRVFAAQALHDMGVSLEVIQRIGHWLLDSFGTAYIVPGFTPEALLALAFWPGAAQKDFSGYWAERFHVSVPSELVYLLMPGLDRLEAAAEELARKASSRSSPDREAASHAKRMVQVLKMGAVVVVQDALELAEKFPDNPLHAVLLKEPAFRTLSEQYSAFKGMGGFEEQRPLSVKQHMQQLNRKLEQLFRGQVVISPAPTAGHGQQKGQQQQGQQQQQQGSSSSRQDLVDLLQQLALFAGGAAKPSQEQLSICAQQASKLLEDMEGELPFADWEAATQDDDQQDDDAQEGSEGPGMQQQSGATPSAAAAATAAAAASGAGDGQPGSSRQAAPSWRAGEAAAGGPGSSSGAAEAAADRAGSSSRAAEAAAGTPSRQQVPALQQDGDAPLSGQHMTPSGQQYSRQQLRERGVSTISPGGHLTAFFSMQPNGRGPTLHTQQEQQQREQRGIAAAGYGGDDVQQQLQALIAQAEALQAARQSAAEDLAVVQDMLLPQAEGSLPEGRQQQAELQQQQLLLSQEVQDLVLQLRENKLQQLQLRAQLRQQQLQQPASYAASRHALAAAAGGGQDTAGEGLLRRMGPAVDPVNAIFHPYTAQRGISLSAYEPVLPPVQQAGGSVPAAAVVEALGRLTDEVRALAAGQAGAGAAAAAAAAANTNSRPSSSKQAAGVAEHGSQGGAAAAAQAGSTPQRSRGSSSSSSSSSKEYAFPNFGKKTVQQAAKWYHDTPLADRLTAKEEGDCKGWTPAQMQEQKKEQWRGGNRGHRFQRWAEWVHLMRYLGARQWELSQEGGAVVERMDVAAVLDQERGKASLTQFYKRVVAPWVKQQGTESGEELVLGDEEELEVDEVAAATP